MLLAAALAALSCIITKMCRAKCESPLKTLSNVETFVPFATLALKLKKAEVLWSCIRLLYLCPKLLMLQGMNYWLNIHNKAMIT